NAHILHSLLPLLLRTPTSPLFPYTTLFRSMVQHQCLRVPDTWNLRERVEWSCAWAGIRQLRLWPGQAIRNTRIQGPGIQGTSVRSEEHTSELQSLAYLVCRLLLEKKKKC